MGTGRVELALFEGSGRARGAVHQLRHGIHLQASGNLLDPDRQSLERTPGKHADLAVGTRFGTGGSGDLVGDLHLGGGFHGEHRVVPLHFGCEVLSTRRARLGDVVDVVAVPVEGSTIRDPLGQLRGRGVELDGLGDRQHPVRLKLSLEKVRFGVRFVGMGLRHTNQAEQQHERDQQQADCTHLGLLGSKFSLLTVQHERGKFVPSALTAPRPPMRLP